MNISEIIQFIHEVEQLKCELRHSWLSDRRQESVAEHTWRMCMMAILMAPKLDREIDINRALQMMVVHDLNEVYVGDVPVFSSHREQQSEFEKNAMDALTEKYSDPSIEHISDLWHEFNAGETLEAKFVIALDKLEVEIQHQQADISTWLDIEYELCFRGHQKYCQHDTFLQKFSQYVEQQAEAKIHNESEKNIQDLKEQAQGNE